MYHECGPLSVERCGRARIWHFGICELSSSNCASNANKCMGTIGLTKTRMKIGCTYFLKRSCHVGLRRLLLTIRHFQKISANKLEIRINMFILTMCSIDEEERSSELSSQRNLQESHLCNGVPLATLPSATPRTFQSQNEARKTRRHTNLHPLPPACYLLKSLIWHAVRILELHPSRCLFHHLRF